MSLSPLGPRRYSKQQFIDQCWLNVNQCLVCWLKVTLTLLMYSRGKVENKRRISSSLENSEQETSRPIHPTDCVFIIVSQLDSHLCVCLTHLLSLWLDRGSNCSKLETLSDVAIGSHRKHRYIDERRFCSFFDQIKHNQPLLGDVKMHPQIKASSKYTTVLSLFLPLTVGLRRPPMCSPSSAGLIELRFSKKLLIWQNVYHWTEGREMLAKHFSLLLGVK